MLDVGEGQSKGEFPFPLIKYLLSRSSAALPVKYLLSELRRKVGHVAIHEETAWAGQMEVRSPIFKSSVNTRALCVHGEKKNHWRIFLPTGELLNRN